MVVLSTESIHKVKVTNNAFYFIIDFIENNPTVISCEVKSKNGRFVTVIMMFPCFPVVVQFAKWINIKHNAERIRPPFFCFFFSVRFNDDEMETIPHIIIVVGIPFDRLTIVII